MTADVSAFLGKPWRPVADGPDLFDCWGLTRAASLALYGRALPTLPDGWRPAADDVAAMGWVEQEAPAAGDVVALGNYAGHIRHVCLSLGGSRVLNTCRGLGSHVGTLQVLRVTYPIVRFYRWT